MKKLIAIFTMTLFSASAWAVPSIKANVNGMVCAFCAKGIEKKLKALPQAQAVFVDLKQHIVVLELKDGQRVPLDDFKQIIEDAGYEATSAELVEKSAAQIRSEIAQ